MAVQDGHPHRPRVARPDKVRHDMELWVRFVAGVLCTVRCVVRSFVMLISRGIVSRRSTTSLWCAPPRAGGGVAADPWSPLPPYASLFFLVPWYWMCGCLCVLSVFDEDHSKLRTHSSGGLSGAEHSSPVGACCTVSVVDVELFVLRSICVFATCTRTSRPKS